MMMMKCLNTEHEKRNNKTPNGMAMKENKNERDTIVWRQKWNWNCGIENVALKNAWKYQQQILSAQHAENCLHILEY